MPCCDICSPSLFHRTRPGAPSKQKKSKSSVQGEVAIDAVKKVLEWRHTIFQRDHANAQYDARCIMDEDTVQLVCSLGPLTPEIVKVHLQDTWFWWDEYGVELTALLCALELTFVPLPSTRRTAPSHKRHITEVTSGQTHLTEGILDTGSPHPKRVRVGSMETVTSGKGFSVP